MKFGKQYEFHKIPEWSEHYFDYNQVKKLLKEFKKKHRSVMTNKKNTMKNLLKKSSIFSIIQEDKISTAEEVKRIKEAENIININDKSPFNHRSNSAKVQTPKSINFKNTSLFSKDNNLQEKLVEEKEEKDQDVISVDEIAENNPHENKRKFIELFKEKIEIVEKFFISELNSHLEKYESLVNKIDDRKSEIFGDSISLPLDNSKARANFQQIFMKENAERDELGYAVSWKRAFSQLYNLTSWLHSYCTINFIACQKILKKFSKTLKEQGLENADEELNEELKNLNFVSKLKDVIELRKKINVYYAETFTSFDQDQSENELMDRMKGNRSKDRTLIAFNLGMIISNLLGLILLWLYHIQDPKEEDSLSVFFPSYNFSFILIFTLLGVAANIFILRKYRINYIYIFEVDPKSRLGYMEIIRTSLLLLNVWCLLLLLTRASLIFDLFDNKFFFFPLFEMCFYCIFMLWPFHCFYYEFRKSILITLLRNIFPLGKNGVRFRDFMFGDILTSLTRPFSSIVLALCLFSCRQCQEDNVRLDCDRKSVAALVLILCPFIIRLFQCLNRFYYTKMAWPHLGNALKYCGGITYNVFSWVYSRNKPEYYYQFVIVGVVANLYMLFWDIYMDWNLARTFSLKNNFFLREKIVYPKWMYYSAIVINSLLRFTWLTSLLDKDKLPLDDETMVFILSFLEIYRRTQWSLFRIENENTNNPEKYRTILDIPQLPFD